MTARNPYDTACFLNRYYHMYFTGFIISAYKEDKIPITSYFETAATDKLHNLYPKYQRCYNLSRHKSSSLFFAAMRFSGMQTLLATCLIFLEAMLTTCGAFLLGDLLRRISAGDELVYLPCVGLCLVTLLYPLIHPITFFTMFQAAYQLRVVQTMFMYERVARLRTFMLGSTTSGEILNIISTDLGKFDFSIMFIAFILEAPFYLCVKTVCAYFMLGWAGVMGCMLFVLLVPFQLAFSRLFSLFRARIAAISDQRVKLMREVILGIRVIKMYVWEQSFADLIASLRSREVWEYEKMHMLNGLNFGIFQCTPQLVVAITVLLMLLVQRVHLTPDVLFAYVLLLSDLRFHAQLFTLALPFLSEIRVSFNRMQKVVDIRTDIAFYLAASNDPPDTCGDNRRLVLSRQGPGPFESTVDEPPVTSSVGVIHVDKLCATYDSHSSQTNTGFALQHVSFDAAPGDLLIIAGPVGSGKSSVLHALLDEMIVKSGSKSVQGTVSFSAQDPFIFSGSVRDNILFGRPMDTLWYRRVVRACALDKDLQQLPSGDITLVGERGVMLSGGQKARVSLARAVYRSCDIVLLDDPLSAVDSHVSLSLFDQCICGLLAEKTVILATHQARYFSRADKVLALDKGRMVAFGTGKQIESRADIVNLAGADITAPEDAIDESPVESEDELSVFLRPPSLTDDTSIQTKGLPTVLDDPTAAAQDESKSVGDIVSSEISLAHAGCDEIEAEESGKISVALYYHFFDMAGPKLVTGLILLICGLVVVAQIMSDKVLSLWSQSNLDVEEASVATQRRWAPRFNDSRATEVTDGLLELRDWDFMTWYVALVGAYLVLSIISAASFCITLARASRNLHDSMFERMLRVNTKFFDDNPSGQVLNKFSKDVGIVDVELNRAFFDLARMALMTVGFYIAICVTEVRVVLVSGPLVLTFFCLRVVYLPASRAIKRKEASARSPVFSHVSVTLSSLASIHAFRQEQFALDEMQRLLDRHTGMWFMYLAGNRWLGFLIDLVMATFQLVAVLLAAFARPDSVSPADVGFILVYTFSMLGMTQYMVRQSCEVENLMTSVERIMHYTKLPAESALAGSAPPDNWPSRGAISFINISLRYSPNLNPALTRFSLRIDAGEKIGVCGRTGAGKSSMIALLMRLVEPYEGQVEIDGVDCSSIHLRALRSAISIIPQDPVLFSRTIRANLDPFSNFSDQLIWNALEKVELKETITELPESLDTMVADGGGNLSVGQRQLLCLARAVLNHSPILLVDEATANVDFRTDRIIQKTLRETFEKCTVLTIAHRIHTIMHCDRVIVLDRGRLVEQGPPHQLAANSRSFFAKLCSHQHPQ